MRYSNQEMLDSKQLAELLNLSEITIARLRLTGRGPRFCKIGRAVRYRRSDVEQWLKQNQRSSTSERED